VFCSAVTVVTPRMYTGRDVNLSLSYCMSLSAGIIRANAFWGLMLCRFAGPYKTRPVGRPRLRWMDQVEEDLKRMKIVGWRAKVKDRQEWNRNVEQIKTHPGL